MDSVINSKTKIAIAYPDKPWELPFKTAKIKISKATVAYPAGTILSAKTGTFTKVTTALEGVCYIVANDVDVNATEANVLIDANAYLEALNKINSTSFTMADVLSATWAGKVLVMDRKEVVVHE